MGLTTEFPRIKEVRTFIIDGVGSGGLPQCQGRPLAGRQQYFHSYDQVGTIPWLANVVGINVLDHSAATRMLADPATFNRFLVGADPRDTNDLFEKMYRASMFYGRKGLPVAVISVIDLALWDLQGKIRKEPVYKLIGGATRARLNFYCTGPQPGSAKAAGFIGAKVALPHGPDEGTEGLLKNVEYLRQQREKVGADFPLRVDCYMSLTVSYTIQLVKRCEAIGLDIDWWEECLSPDDFDGHALLKRAHPTVTFTTGEHEYSRYGFRKLIEGRNVDILQPDVMWVGGMTELLKVSAMAAAYDLPVVPHASGPYSYHFVVSQSNSPFQEYLANSADGHIVEPVFGNLFLNEPIPTKGYLDVSVLDKPGFGLELNPLLPDPGCCYPYTCTQKSLRAPDNEEAANGSA
ncbi:hypothetical protein PDIDSM_8872 [Penicillium digitatum]|nr:hypothetical protein PDIDSM_8872 [Penicillium digitatum]